MTARTQRPATSSDEAPRRVPVRAWAPTRGDAVAAAASRVVGGPLGRHAVVGARGWRPAAAVLSALASVFVALGVLQKNHCVSAGWATPGSLWRACYSDLPVAVGSAAGATPWENPAIGGAPPLTAVLTWVVRLLVPGGSQLRQQQGMFAWGAAAIALLIAVAVCFTAAAMPRGPWVAAHVALSPVLITSALISFDALAVALVAAGLWAWRRQRLATSGALLAAALLARPSLGAVLAAALVVTAARGQNRAAGRLLAGAAPVVVVAFGAMMLAGADPFAGLTAWRSQTASYGSLWHVLALAGVAIAPSTLTLLSLLGWLVAAALGWLLARGDRTLPLAPVALVMLVVVMVTGRALPVQAALWVLPLVALCAVRWRDHLVWAGAEFAYFVIIWGFVARDSNGAKALPQEWYAFFVGLRLVALFFLVRAGVTAAASIKDEVAARRPRPQELAPRDGNG